jgi:hypothetical protein
LVWCRVVGQIIVLVSSGWLDYWPGVDSYSDHWSSVEWSDHWSGFEFLVRSLSWCREVGQIIGLMSSGQIIGLVSSG